MALIAIMGIALIGCGGNDDSPQEKPKKQPDTLRTLTFGTDCKVTISSDDKFTASEWNTLCDNVVTAINSKSSTGIESFSTIFASNQNATVVLGNNFTHNWEVKSSEFRTVYIKTTSINTVNFTEIIEYMEADYPGHNE